MGLIGSGSLLIVCRAEACEGLLHAIGEAGIAVACIGEVKRPGQGVVARQAGIAVAWPEFEVDEITRLF
jgi:hypothetical protein